MNIDPRNKVLGGIALGLFFLLFLFLYAKDNGLTDASQGRLDNATRLYEDVDDTLLSEKKEQPIEGEQEGDREQLQKIISQISQRDLKQSSSGSYDNQKVSQLDYYLELYEDRPSEPILKRALLLSIETNSFDTAYYLLGKYSNVVDLHTVITPQSYFYILFNTQDMSFKNIQIIKKLLEGYLSKDLLSKEDFSLYSSLITLLRNDLGNFKYFLDELRQSEDYKDRYNSYTTAVRKYKSYSDVPEYYLYGLLGIEAYRSGWYRVAQRVGLQLQELDPKYILGYQLVSYSSIVLGDNELGEESLRYLLEKDDTYKDLYLFLLGGMYRSTKEYEKMILHLNRIRSKEFNSDVLRYKLSGFFELGDGDAAMRLVPELLSQKGVSSFDYYTVYSYLFFSGDISTTARYVELLGAELDPIISSCYESEENFDKSICLYGKAGLYYSLGDYSAAYKFLSKFSESSQHSEIFELLGFLAEELGNSQKAKERYIKALMVSSSRDPDLILREKIKKLLD